MKSEFDPVSGRSTTGHEWDGIKELDTPVPKVARVALYGSIAIAAVYWVLLPAWPYVTDFTRGTLDHSTRSAILDVMSAAGQARALVDQDLVAADLEELIGDREVRARLKAPASVLYRDNCLVCHGPALSGQTGFPDLSDAHWLWPGTPEEVETTISYGSNAAHDETRYAEMPAFGRNGLLEREDFDAVSEYVLSLQGAAHDVSLTDIGALVFEENCASCHGDAGEGGYENGAPNLADSAWIYGGSRDEIRETLHSGRQGVMPAWADRLSAADIRKLTLFLMWEGQDDDG
jgi:cytochrome c oxidase cbb3-type subunit III